MDALLPLQIGDHSLEVLRNDGECVVYRRWRAGAAGERSRVLAAVAAAEQPAPGVFDRFAHEFSLKSELEPGWAARPVELVREAGRTILVLQDPGGEPLERLLGAPMPVDQFLPLAIAIAETLGKVHRRGLVHRDVKPANILVSRASGQVWLTGFGLASRLPRERQPPEPPETIAGTLAYMAPEQTGWMNRWIDSRSDLYSMGVTFYQILTGLLPFAATEPLEWVHCHVALRAVPPSGRLKEIPSAISEIVAKLLAKTAEDRYQSAAGVASDLRRCLAEWKARGRIGDFPLGEQDMPDWLLIPEKLYGRQRQIATLLAAFDRVITSGTPELVLVSGYSGIGKSSVVNELHKMLVPPRGLFASGKFDQYKRDIPYFTLAQAFQSLIRHLLAKSDAELAGWRDALREALGANGQLMVDLVPELRLIIGDQPPVPDLPVQQARGRFQLVLRRFIGVFARPEHPLALFLDDLQWLDRATLDLLEDLLTRADVQHLLLIGAYRDNEVDAAHPLTRKLEAIRQAGGTAPEVRLSPLTREHVGQLIADSLRCEPEHSATLAELVHEKTAGNPFFVIRLLYTLSEEGLLAFDHDDARWCWDLDRIQAKGYTDNVVDLMVGKLTCLPAETQNALQNLALLGNVAEAAVLAVVLETSEEQVHAALWHALRQELVERLAGAYRFVHDRVQEAAFSLIPEELRATNHLRIGRLLMVQTPAERRQEAIFEIVNPLNRATALITSRDEREELAELNLIAAKRARGSTAYASALNYLTTGAALLDSGCWERRHDLIFQLELNRAECEFLTGAPTDSEERLAALSTQAANAVEGAAVACLRVDLYTTLTQYDNAVAVSINYLRHVGIDWSPHPTEEDMRREYDRIWSLIGTRTIEELIDLPPMTDPASLATLDVITKVLPPAQFTDAHLFYLAVSRAVTLSLEGGNSDGSCVAYVMLGMVAGLYFGDYKVGFRFGQLGYDLVERRALRRFRARTYASFANNVIPSVKHVLVARNLLRRAFEAASESGDLTSAAYICLNLSVNFLAAGDPLVEAQREAEQGLEFARKARFRHAIDILTASLALIRTLRGLTPNFGSLADGQFDETRFERNFPGNPAFAMPEYRHWVRKLQALFFAGDYAAAVDASLRAQRLLWASPAQLEASEYHFYAALSRAAALDYAPADQRQRYVEALNAHYEKLQVWAENCSENFENRAALVGAEIARIDGRVLAAERMYEQAIRSARANGFVHNEAIAYERASAFYRARGFEQIADLYLRNARYGYLRWGADGKIRQLDDLYPHLRADEPAPAPTSTIGAPLEQLDLATVIKVSQAVSGEMVLEKLLEMLMRCAIAHAGAERGLLILAEGTGDRVAAEATIAGELVDVRILPEQAAGATLPKSLVQYVARTRERVILDDASAENPFAADEYIRERHPRSILCLPLINQNKLVGVLYLENNLAPRVFTPGRIAVLQLLASQAAISVENTRLYRDLEERESKIRRLVDANIIGIIFWNLEGEITDANDAFLRMVGYTREDVLGGRVRWTDLTPPDLRARHAELLAQFKTTGTIQPWEREYFRKDGSRVPVLVGSAGFGERRDQAVSFVLDLTERRRAEQALRVSEERFRTLVQFSFDIYWETDAEHRITRQEFQTGHADAPTPGAEIGKTRWEVPYLEPDAEAWRKHRETLDAHLPFRDFELARPTSDGGKRYWSNSGLPVFDDGGRFIGYRGVGRYITARKRAEQALRDSEEQWRAVFENNPTMYFMIDAAGTIASVNPFGAEQLGYTTDELVGRPVVGLFHEADRAAVERNAAACFQQLGRTMSWELRRLRKDGTLIWVRETARAMPIKQRPILLIVCEDISERKQAEHLTQQWFESSPNVLAIIGRDYRYQRVNPLYERYWGIPAERIVGKHVAEFRGRNAFETVIKPRLDLCFTGEEQEHRYTEWTDLPIGRRYVMVTYTPLRPRSEQVEAALVIHSDLTEYELAAEALRAAQAELAHMNRVTTIGQLTATIAHEVNQPIAAAVTNAQAALRWLRARPPDLQEAGEALARIVENSNRAGDVIGRIRALVKKAPAPMEPIDINETISEVIALTHGEILKNGVALNTRLGANLPPVRGDRVQLAQVILNFVVNAVEAMKSAGEGPRELLVASERDGSDGVLVSVRDSGAGLSPEHRDRLFEPFYTTKPDGMGMGLSICRSIIEAHGGRVWATANVPRGAAFQFTLPACHQVEP